MNPGEYNKEIHVRVDRQSGQLSFYDPRHHLARKNGMVSLGRHLLSVRLGRWLEPGEYVHFIDGNPTNTSVENLMLTSMPELSRLLHNRQMELVCPYCGEVFRVSRSHKDRRVHCTNQCRNLHKRKFEVDREDLEAMIWQMPTTEVAGIFGVSDKAVEKRCRLLGIPKPPRGYWAKLAAGEDRQRRESSEFQGDVE